MPNYKEHSDSIMMFSDLHYGIDGNSEQGLRTCDRTVDWIIETCRARNTQLVVFGGDWFDHKDTLSVKTLNAGYAALKRMTTAGLTVYLILGNHDLYYKEKNDVNSLVAFQEMPGVVLVSQTSVLTVGDGAFGPGKQRKFCLVPWTCVPEEYLEESCDAIIGHMEVKGVQQRAGGGPGSTSDKGFPMTSFFPISPLVFIGHYHIRNTYQFKEGIVKSIGNPFQMDVGDRGQEKGIVHLSLDDMEETFLENTFAPKYVDILYSQASADPAYVTEAMVKGNYPRLIVDAEQDWDVYNKIVARINSFHPTKPPSPKYLHNVSFQGKLSSATKELELSTSENLPTGSVEEATMVYIDQVLVRMESSLDPARMKTLASKYLSSPSSTSKE